MDRLFNMDNKFFTVMSRVADLIILNLICIVCCAPLITAGASITAMFYVTLKMVRNEEAYILRSFFRSFKQNFKQATIIHLIMLLVAFVLYWDIHLCNIMGGTLSKVLLIIFYMILVIFIMVFMYIYPVLAKFYNTIKNTFTNAFLMSVRHLPYTFLMVLISIAPVAVLYFIQDGRTQMNVVIILVLIGFSGVAYLNSFFFVKIFDKYIPKEEPEGDTQIEGKADAAAPSIEKAEADTPLTGKADAATPSMEKAEEAAPRTEKTKVADNSDKPAL